MSSADLLVVVADPDPDARSATMDALREEGMEPVACESVSDVLTALEQRDVDCVVTERVLGNDEWDDVLEAVRETRPDCPCILFTDGQVGSVLTSRTELIVEYLPKTLPEARERLAALIEETTRGRFQVAYPVPDDEDARIEKLREYDVEELRTTAAFDRLTKLIARHFDVAVAFVGLVDEHEEEFIACEGADWKYLEREDTICTHTILENDVLVVENVQEDPRFEANDRLEGLEIRSYAGTQLVVDGQAIGALCVIDDEPRGYSEAEKRDLRLFAQEVVEQLKLRRKLSETSETSVEMK
ncbi:MAG: GAF domain-containing protein [Haloarculaceae archaeon]